jgi:hypothetical protein
LAAVAVALGTYPSKHRGKVTDVSRSDGQKARR